MLLSQSPNYVQISLKIYPASLHNCHCISYISFINIPSFLESVFYTSLTPAYSSTHCNLPSVSVVLLKLMWKENKLFILLDLFVVAELLSTIFLLKLSCFGLLGQSYLFVFLLTSLNITSHLSLLGHLPLLVIPRIMSLCLYSLYTVSWPLSSTHASNYKNIML